MKIILLLMMIVVALSSASAHAISEKYRKQLEKSGCTQVSELQGCDITKTKAENAKAGFVNAAPSQDAKVKGTPYHATGTIPCAMAEAKPGSAHCAFGVLRGKPGNAQVYITRPDGFKRILVFRGAEVSAQESSVKVSKSADNWFIDVNADEHYQIPDAVIVGG